MRHGSRRTTLYTKHDTEQISCRDGVKARSRIDGRRASRLASEIYTSDTSVQRWSSERPDSGQSSGICYRYCSLLGTTTTAASQLPTAISSGNAAIRDVAGTMHHRAR